MLNLTFLQFKELQKKKIIILPVLKDEPTDGTPAPQDGTPGQGGGVPINPPPGTPADDDGQDDPSPAPAP